MQPEYIRNDGMVRLVGGRRLEAADESQIACVYREAELFESSLTTAASAVSRGSILPPGCMKAIVPRLRTSSVFPSGRSTKAAAIRIVFAMP